MSADLSLRARIELASELNAIALRERLFRAECDPQPDFVESSIAGLDVRELDALPDDSIDLLQVVREAEGRAR